jgi:hypothetical protein
LKGPRLFLNSVPKSGTHMLQQIVSAMPTMKLNANGQFYEGYTQQISDHRLRLSMMKPCEFGAGHVYHSSEWAKMIQGLGHRHIFLSRDPRDIVVSFAYFIADRYPQHELHPYFKYELKTQKQRYLALIQGIRNSQLQYPDIVEWMDRFIGWAYDKRTLHITYEQLMSSVHQRQSTLFRLATYVWSGYNPPMPIAQMVNKMNANMNPQRSYTFRKGGIGNWRKEFDEETKSIFKQKAGKLLIQLGYEKDHIW